MAVFASIVSGAVFAASTSAWQCGALILVLCITNQSMLVTTLCIIGFYTAACLPVLNVVLDYSANSISAFSVYLLLVAINVIVLLTAALQSRVVKWIAIPLAFVILSVPPLSGINPVSIAPIAGWLFPSTGALGLLGLIALVSGLCARNTIRIPLALAAIVIGISSTAVYANIEDDDIAGIDIVRDTNNELMQEVLRTAYRYEEQSMVQDSVAEIVFLPESIFGVWDAADGQIHSLSSKTVYGGARKYINDSEYVNVVVNAKTGAVIYEQKNPPIVPFRKGVKAIKGNGAVDDYAFDILICYEATDSWLAMKTFNSSNTVVWVSNLSWSRSHYLERRMASTLEAWSRLYKTKTHRAVLQHA